MIHLQDGESILGAIPDPAVAPYRTGGQDVIWVIIRGAGSNALRSVPIVTDHITNPMRRLLILGAEYQRLLLAEIKRDYP